MEISKLRQLDDKKLAAELNNAHVSLHKLLAERAMMTMKDTSNFAKTKKAIARIKTIMSERSKLKAFEAPQEVSNDK